MDFKDQNYWALILGGSSGIGLASAHKLAKMGMNLFIVHRDRRGSMTGINEQFKILESHGSQVCTLNINALSADGRQTAINTLADFLNGGRVRLLLHSIALGNLKLLAPQKQRKNALDELAKALNIDTNTLKAKVEDVFSKGLDDLCPLLPPPEFNQELLINDEDLTQTIQNMGTDIVSWVQDLFKREMFSSDARVIGLTSEGNTTAWRGYAAVAAAKSALESVSRAIAKEFAPFGIRSNIIQAGITDTPALNLIPGSQHMKANARLRNPFGRLTSPEDVANVVGLLALDEAAWINGTIIRADGGEHISG